MKTKWNILPEDQRKGIRQVLSDLIIQVATAADSAKNRVYLHKLNVVLVQVRVIVLQVLIAQPMKWLLQSRVDDSDHIPMHAASVHPGTWARQQPRHHSAAWVRGTLFLTSEIVASPPMIPRDSVPRSAVCACPTEAHRAWRIAVGNVIV